jgi:hypothetical protein
MHNPLASPATPAASNAPLLHERIYLASQAMHNAPTYERFRNAQIEWQEAVEVEQQQKRYNR